MKRLFLFLFFLILFGNQQNIFAQPTIQWEKNFGGNSNEIIFGDKTVQQTMDGGYIVVGTTSSSSNGDISRTNKGSYDYWIVKLDSTGNIQWEKNYGGSESDIARSIEQTKDGGYIVAGTTKSSSNGDVSGTNKGNSNTNDYWIVKLDRVGNIQWEKNYGGSESDIARSIQQTLDDGYIVAGYTLSSANGDVSGINKGQIDYWIVKLDSIGNIQWEKNYGGSESDIVLSIQQTSDRGYIMTGYIESSFNGDVSRINNGGFDCWVLKLDEIGNIKWEKNFGGNQDDVARSIQQTSDKGYIVAGATESSASGDVSGINNGIIDCWVLKLDSTGNIQWEKNYGGNGYEAFNSIQQTINGNYIVTGVTESSSSGDVSRINNGSGDCWIVKLNNIGNLQWEKNFGGDESDLANSIQQTTGENFVIAGETQSSASGDVSGMNKGSQDIWIVKLNAIPSSIPKEKKLEQAIQIFPNPTQGLLNIQFKENNQNPFQVLVYDLNGKVLMNKNELLGNQQLDISELSNGIYLVKVLQDDVVKVARISVVK